MGDKSTIEWTDATWNPVTGCTKVSQGCKHCYAERVFPRAYGKDRKFTDVRCHPERLDQPLRWKRPRRIFVNSMSDLFHEDVPDEFISRVIATIIKCLVTSPGHIFQILTKRPERMRKYFANAQGKSITGVGWRPLSNVWLGVSCEDQATANERIPLLLQTPAALRFVSAEPLLGPVDFAIDHGNYDVRDYLRGAYQYGESGDAAGVGAGVVTEKGEKIDWVIVGGESGPGARTCDVEWIRDIVRQCKAVGTACFVKQLGTQSRGWCEWNSTQHFHDDEYQQRLKEGVDFSECVNYEAHELADHCESYGQRCMMIFDHKGGDMAEWPNDLKIREFPV